MCSLSAENKDGNVYKRRKMNKDSNALLADEEVKEMAPSNSYKELSSHGNGECSSPLTEAPSPSTSSVGLPAVNKMCSLSAENKDGNVYKRRKMNKDSNALLADEEVKEMAPSNSYKELSSHGNGECSSPLTEAPSPSTSSVGLPAVNKMCSLSAENKDGNVYKRRKMNKDSNALLADEEVKEMAPSNSYKELSSHGNGECGSPLTEAPSPSTSSVGLPAVNKMCSLSAENKDVNVYKRRKMNRDSNALLADEEVKEMATKSCTNADPTFSNLTAGKIDPVLEIEEPAGVSLEPDSVVKERCSLPSVPPSSVMLDKNAAAECSSADMSPTEPITEITSARDLCIAILRKDGLLTESRTRITSEKSTDCNANHLLPCNTCGSLDDPLKMLICDSCEAAFHLSCCIPCIKEVPADEWYCPPCFRKKPKSLYGKLLEGKVKSSGNMDQLPHGMSHIEYMLKGDESYVSGVRIDRDLQAEVPEWSAPTFSDGYFEAPSEFYPADVTRLNWCTTNNHNRSSRSIGNWIQCREILSTGDSNKPVICGKWRRVPLYVVQSNKWDCSCCLPWDPAHADCAVPQELDTDEVLKQLKCVNMVLKQMKCVNMLKSRLDHPNHKPA